MQGGGGNDSNWPNRAGSLHSKEAGDEGFLGLSTGMAYGVFKPGHLPNFGEAD
jgi:hypothetical protein